MLSTSAGSAPVLPNQCGTWLSLPFAVFPALAPALLALESGTYGFLYAVAGGCALLGAAAISPVRGGR
jgi:hypothetical protein